MQQVPLTSQPNQTFNITLTINGKNIPFTLIVRYNMFAGYWVLTIQNGATSPPTTILDSIPLLCGLSPAGNLLNQYAYLSIGKWYLINAVNDSAGQPSQSNLGNSYLLWVGDN